MKLSRKRLRLAALLGSLLLIIIGAGLFGWTLFRLQYLDLDKAARTLIARTQLLADRAETFDSKTALASLRPTAGSAFSFRLDDHLDRAIFEPRSEVVPAKVLDPHTILYNFDESDKTRWEGVPENASLNDGLLAFPYEIGGSLRSPPDFQIPAASLAKIAIRIKSEKGRKIKLAWSDDADAELKSFNDKTMGFTTINTVAGGEFHEYAIDMRPLLYRSKKTKIVRRIFFQPSDVAGDDITIDHIHIYSTAADYATRDFGTTYETIDQEMRPAIYVSKSSQLAFAIPPGSDALTFSCSIGTLSNSLPAVFTFHYSDSDSTTTLLTKRYRRSDGWKNIRFSLPEGSSEGGRIILRVELPAAQIAFWANPILFAPPAEKQHVFIILEDTLRADHLSFQGYERQTSPAKQALIETEGAIFESAISQSTKTRVSCPSFMTSLYPTATGVFNHTQQLDSAYLTLAEILRSQGFATGAFVENANGGANNGLHQGFGTSRREGRVLEDRRVNIENWIERNSGRNLFAYIHVLDPHGPYDPDPEFRNWYDEVAGADSYADADETLDPDWMIDPTLESRIALYDGLIRQNDERIASFIEYVKEADIYEDSLFLFISDHGEFFGEHGLWSHRPPNFRPGVHVPLSIVSPGLDLKGQRFNDPVQLLDVMPTILDYCGFDTTELLMQGNSLMPFLRNPTEQVAPPQIAYSEEVIDRFPHDDWNGASIFFRKLQIMNSRHFIPRDKWKEGRPTSPLKIRAYDYQGSDGRGEFLFAPYFDLLLKFRTDRLFKTLQAENERIRSSIQGKDSSAAVYDPEALEQLRKLGYID